MPTIETENGFVCFDKNQNIGLHVKVQNTFTLVSHTGISCTEYAEYSTTTCNHLVTLDGRTIECECRYPPQNDNPHNLNNVEYIHTENTLLVATKTNCIATNHYDYKARVVSINERQLIQPQHIVQIRFDNEPPIHVCLSTDTLQLNGKGVNRKLPTKLKWNPE